MNQKAITLSLITDMEPLATLDPEVLLTLTAPLALEADTVHVWAFSLEGTSSVVEACRQVLTAEERQRADRFVFDHDRRHHIIAHGVLRHVLSRYCGDSPDSLRFATTGSGKPSIRGRALGQTAAASAPASSLQFNLTHSDDRALLGVSAGRELGVDLERVRSNVETVDISRHYFFGAEREAIESAVSVMRDMTFFRYWVAKEAVLKAQGVGLGFPLDRFCIHFHPDADTAHIETLDPAVLEPEWTVRMLTCDAGWAAAVAARGNDWQVKVAGKAM